MTNYRDSEITEELMIAFWDKPWKCIAGIALLAAVVWNSFYVVPETETAFVTLFGRPTRTVMEAGLYFKWPVQGLQRFEKRLMFYNPRPSEFLAKDKKNLVIDNAVLWRIVDPGLYLKTLGDTVLAEMRLHDIVWAVLAAEVGKVELSDLVSVEPGRVKAPALMQRVRQAANTIAMLHFGIEVADVQLKRLTFPEQNKQSVFARMRAERQRIAKQYRAEGEEEAIRIRAEADKQRDVLLAEAYREAEKLKGHGDAESTRIYGEAYSKDPQFYKLVRTLDSYRKILDDKTSIILSSDSELLRLLTQGRKGGSQ
jgi:membrane protease subunit HflC